MKIIDFHTHCFPEKIARIAIAKLSHSIGNFESFHAGSEKDLLKSMDENGVFASVVLNISTNPNQQTNVNDFAADINSGRLIAFGSVHPDSKNVMEELERIKSMGLKGVKFHSEYQNFSPDDSKMLPIYKKIGDLGLITTFHSGVDLGFSYPNKATPQKIAKILDAFNGSPVIAAHWGSNMLSDEVVKYLCETDVYLDLSMGYGIIPKPMAIKILEKHGTDKLFFASDSPWHSPKMEIKFIESLGLSEEEKEKIYHKNAEKILKIIGV